jgi:hypothetical protein
MLEGHAGKALGVHPSAVRYAAPTGTVLIRWDGARQPLIWTVPRPEVAPQAALRELARRYLHVFGPATPESFAGWAGIRPHRGVAAFKSISRSLLPATTPIGEGWILARDEPELRTNAGPEALARLLPSGDTYFLLQGADRELLVPHARRRGELWTSRVWPGALLVDGEIAGTWRRSQEKVSIQAWRRMSAAERGAVEAEAASLPLPGIEGKPITVRWLR